MLGGGAQARKRDIERERGKERWREREGSLSGGQVRCRVRSRAEQRPALFAVQDDDESDAMHEPRETSGRVGEFVARCALACTDGSGPTNRNQTGI